MCIKNARPPKTQVKAPKRRLKPQQVPDFLPKFSKVSHRTKFLRTNEKKKKAPYIVGSSPRTCLFVSPPPKSDRDPSRSPRRRLHEGHGAAASFQDAPDAACVQDAADVASSQDVASSSGHQLQQQRHRLGRPSIY